MFGYVCGRHWLLQGTAPQQWYCSLVTKMPVAVGMNAGATPCLVYTGSKESELFRLWGRVWAEEARKRRERKPQMV